MNWDETAPGAEALDRFKSIEDEGSEFPETYSGSAWRAAYRIWKAVCERGESSLNASNFPEVYGLGISGFQFGWAVNAVRQMLGKKPGTNPAIIEIGGPDPIVPATGPAENDMREAIGGK